MKPTTTTTRGFQKIKLIYYTDPVCSTCWTFEPYLFKFLKCYEAFVDVEYRMGGLLEDWNTLTRFDKHYSNEQFLKELWEAESERFQIGIDSKIWRNGRIQSSYPCCIAYYAVLEQGKEKAEKFLRKLREFLFICGKDISKNAAILTCAIESGIDLDSFNDALSSGRAEQSFRVNLEKKKIDRVKHFPSFILENEVGDCRKILNITDYQFFDEVLRRMDSYISELTDDAIFKKKKHVSPVQLLHKFKYLSFKQLVTICEVDQEVVSHELASEVANGSVICELHNGFAHYKVNETPYHLKRRSLTDRCGIIGGGICGSFLKLTMDQIGVSSMLFEKQSEFTNRGFGFLILQNGIEALDSIGLKNEFLKKGNHMNHFKAVKPDGTILYEKYLDNCIAISREDLHELLRNQISESEIQFDKTFHEFSDGEKGKILHLTDGSVYQADFYAGVDGIRSAVRDHLFGEQKLSEVGEREVVCMVEVENHTFRLDQFYKVVDTENGKTIGVIPLSEHKFIWFLQFNHHIDPLDSKDYSEIKAYTLRSIEHFPESVKELVRNSDFKDAFLWVSQRMDHLTSYFKDNCVLLGDAAHPLLPLTSQGANSALEDAATLADVWSNYRDEMDVNAMLSRYQSLRRDFIAHYISDGDALAEDFMLLSTNKKFKLPLTIH